MKLQLLHEMGAATVCPKCGLGPMSKTHYWYQGAWKCRAGAQGSAAPQPAATPRTAATASGLAAKTPAPAVTVARPAVPTNVITQGNTVPRASAQGMPAATQRKMLETFLTKLDIKNFTIAPDLSVSVQGDVKVSSSRFIKVPCKFTTVTGDFTWTSGELTSMLNMPDKVGGDFNVSNNDISSLEGLPQVAANIDLSDNKITSWHGLPEKVGGDLGLDSNPATDVVENLPAEVFGTLFVGSTGKWSLRGIHKKSAVYGTIVVVGELDEGGLGLMLVKGLTGVQTFNQNDKSPTNPKEAFQMIEKAREDKEDVLDVQEKLIDAGFSRYAKL